jgi:hypothetical protein
LPQRIDAPVLQPALMPGVGIVRDHDITPSRRRRYSTSASAPISWAPCTASPVRSNVFEGIQAQYEHSPPTSSRFDDCDPKTALRERPSTMFTLGFSADDDHVIVDVASVQRNLHISPSTPLRTFRHTQSAQLLARRSVRAFPGFRSAARNPCREINCRFAAISGI